MGPCNLIEISGDDVLCTKCRYGNLSRTKRVGFLEEYICPYFGYFPWTCYCCKERMMVKSRGERGSGSMMLKRSPLPLPLGLSPKDC
jgi:hypothetical protein